MRRFGGASPRRRKAWLAAGVVLALALAGCGRKGDPLPPPDPNAPSPQATASTTPSLGFTAPPNPPIQRPDKPFLLDPLLK